MIRDLKDIGILALIFLGSVLLVFLVYFATEPVVRDRREQHLTEALTRLAAGESVGEALTVNELPVLAIYPLGGSDAPPLIGELSVMGYRDRLRFVARLSGEGALEGVVVLEESEEPVSDSLLRDPQRLEPALRRGAPEDGNAATRVTVAAMAEAVETLRRMVGNE